MNPPQPANRFHLHRHESRPYIDCLREQQQWAEQIARGERGNQLILTEHPPVITLGANAPPSDAPPTTDALPVIRSDRGGKATCHGPGQLIAYVLKDLRPHAFAVRRHIHLLEETIITALASCGLTASRDPEGVGVWVAGAKIAAIGVRVKNGVAYHGCAINRDPDLTIFRQITPCGLPHRAITSLVALDCPISRNELEQRFLVAFATLFQTTWVE